jgi:hypothetical protein
VKYQVLSKMRWREKNYERGDIISPRCADEEYRCKLLADSGRLALIVEDSLLKNLQAVGGIRPNTRVKPITHVSNGVKQKEEKGD